jgi:hypothetical protein
MICRLHGGKHSQGPGLLIGQPFENQENEGASPVGKPLATHPQIDHRGTALVHEFHLRRSAYRTGSLGSRMKALSHYAIATGGGAPATPFGFRGMNTTQNLPGTLSFHGPPALTHQPRRRRIAVQDAQICVLDKSRARHGVEQHSMKVLIQKLYINCAHVYW